MALAVWFVLFFLSPPLPLYNETCATDWNNPFFLVFAVMLLGARHLFRRAFCRGERTTMPQDAGDDG